MSSARFEVYPNELRVYNNAVQRCIEHLKDLQWLSGFKTPIEALESLKLKPMSEGPGSRHCVIVQATLP